jgi:hypothetical protein
VALFAFAEGSLAGYRESVRWVWDKGAGGGGGGGIEEEGENIRSAVLGFTPGLRGGHVIVIVAVAAAAHGIIIHVPIVDFVVVVLGRRAADGAFVLGERGWWFGYGQAIVGCCRGVEVGVEGVEVLEFEGILWLIGQEGGNWVGRGRRRREGL